MRESSLSNFIILNPILVLLSLTLEQVSTVSAYVEASSSEQQHERQSVISLSNGVVRSWYGTSKVQAHCNMRTMW